MTLPRYFLQVLTHLPSEQNGEKKVPDVPLLNLLVTSHSLKDKVLKNRNVAPPPFLKLQ